MTTVAAPAPTSTRSARPDSAVRSLDAAATASGSSEAANTDLQRLCSGDLDAPDRRCRRWQRAPRGSAERSSAAALAGPRAFEPIRAAAANDVSHPDGRAPAAPGPLRGPRRQSWTASAFSETLRRSRRMACATCIPRGVTGAAASARSAAADRVVIGLGRSWRGSERRDQRDHVRQQLPRQQRRRGVRRWCDRPAFILHVVQVTRETTRGIDSGGVKAVSAGCSDSW